MSLNFYYFSQKFILFLFAVLSFGGILSGMLLCLLASPQSQVDLYILLADNYSDSQYLAQSIGPKNLDQNLELSALD